MMSSSHLQEQNDRPHRRQNALTGDWILVSPHRAKRPWQGQVTKPKQDISVAHDPACFLCAGNRRVTGAINPNYTGPHVFQNDFPALDPSDTSTAPEGGPLFQRQAVRGEARVVCFSERHDLTLAQMDDAMLSRVVDVWCDEYRGLSQEYDWVAIFENKGEMMGCSNPHPHGQIWASDFIPNEVTREDAKQAAYFAQHGRSLLVDYSQAETLARDRVVQETEHWICVVPWWAVWPFETLILPKRAVTDLTDMTDAERADLGPFLGAMMRRYDNLFETSFPYSMGWHGAPPRATEKAHWQLHAHVYPPLLRSADVRKFMVGFELLAEAQRDLPPEQSAARLVSVGDHDFRKRPRGAQE